MKQIWNTNAGHWVKAVRSGQIQSRKDTTNRAILDAVLSLEPVHILDMGCGEGWLVRKLVEISKCTAVGVDISSELIEAARLSDRSSTYLVLDYETITNNPASVEGQFDLIIFNYSLFDEDIIPILTACKRLLTVDGNLLIQTVHPLSMDGNNECENGWREENFNSFPSQGWQPMPWYYRTFDSWTDTIEQTGYGIVEYRESVNALSGKPVSLIFQLA
ncbi:MAG: hypothetical protein DHS20C01_01990 [marine bacterium B5-7]|nr:MAG: hypothetical protein DHS20C01_01990 [marine bacterium B5-7]